MFKFIDENGQESQFNDLVVEIERNISPIKEILGKNDFSSFSVSIDERTFSLEESFQLQVNMKDVGVFRFIFNKDGFDKDTIINEISALRELEVIDAKTAQNKVSALMSIVDQPSLLFVIFESLDYLYIDENYFHDSLNRQIHVFLIKKELTKEQMYELNIGQVSKQDGEVKKKKTIKKEKNESLKAFFKQLGEKKFHFLLILVSTTLFEVSIPLAIVNVYNNNAIYIFLFICSIIGIGMDGYSFFDLFKKHGFRSSMSLASYISNFIGLGVGVGLFALFYNLSNLEDGVPSMTSMIWIGLLVSLIISMAIVTITYFIPKTKKK